MKKIILILSLFFIGTTNLYAENNTIIQNRYNSFIYKLNVKYPLNNQINYIKQINLLGKVNSILVKGLKKTNNQKKIQVYQDFKKVNLEHLVKIKRSKIIFILKEKNELEKNKTTRVGIEKLFYKKLLLVKDGVFFEGSDYFYYYPKRLAYYEINPDEIAISLDGVLLGTGKSTKASDMIIIKTNDGRTLVTKKTNINLKNRIPKNIFDNITNKDKVINVFMSDLYGELNSKKLIEYFQQIKNKAKEIATKSPSKEKLIENIYTFILNHLEYDYDFYESDIKNNDSPVYSPIGSYINKKGVCSGYSKIMLYMLSFTGVENVSEKIGYSMDISREITKGEYHSWIQIGDDFYDPTWDDSTIKENNIINFKYYKLPQKLMYANRYNDGDKNIFEGKTSEGIKKQILARYIQLNYQYKGYKLLDKYNIYTKLGLTEYKKLTIEDLKKVIKYMEINKYGDIIGGQNKGKQITKEYTGFVLELDKLNKNMENIKISNYINNFSIIKSPSGKFLLVDNKNIFIK